MAESGTENSGGSGAGYELPGKGLKDSRLERRALKYGWNVPAEKRRAMIERQAEIAISDPDPRISTQAFLAVVKAQQQDIDLELADDARQTGATYNTQINIKAIPHDELRAITAALRRARELDSGATS